MPNSGPVHWYEGLFLQPHHLQTAQRHALDEAIVERQLAWPYAYGVIESRVSTDALANMLVQFDRLRLIMPSGAVVEFPEAADLPPLDIRSAFQSSSAAFMVNIGVPLWYASRGNTLDGSGSTGKARDADAQAKRLYRVAEIERADENTGENPQPVLVRRVNARLLLDGDDKTDLETMPLVRIAHSAGQDAGLPRQDPAYIPPCLVVRGSPVLYEMLRDLANHVEARRGQLIARMHREKIQMDQLRGMQFAQVMKLRTLNHFSSRLIHLMRATNIAPFTMYLELRGLLGELAALKLEQDLTNVSDYDHDAPSVPWAELVARIRVLLPREGEVTVFTVPFVRAEGLMQAQLSEPHLKKPNDYFLGIKTKQDTKSLSILVEDPDRFKCMAKSLARADIWGIKMAEVKDPPLQLPKPPGLHYYRMQLNETPSSQRMWERIQQEKSVTLRWRELEASDFDVTLYMTVPESEDHR